MDQAARSSIRIAARLLPLATASTRGWRTVKSWIRAANPGGHFRPCFNTTGKNAASSIGTCLVIEAFDPLVARAVRVSRVLERPESAAKASRGSRPALCGIAHDPRPPSRYDWAIPAQITASSWCPDALGCLRPGTRGGAPGGCRGGRGSSTRRPPAAGRPSSRRIG